MSKVTLDQILSGEGTLTRTKTLEIEGVGEFEIHEFPAAPLWEAVDELARPRDDGNQYAAALCVRFLKGAEHEPTDEEIDSLTRTLGREVIDKIIEAGFWFDGRKTTDRADR